MEINTLDATAITWGTCLMVVGDNYPLPSGNCFGVQTEKGEFRIVNFVLENLEEAIRRGITFPIKIHPIDDWTAVIHDERIPDNWYKSRWCEICCPENLLPIPQRLEHDRQIKTGYRAKGKNGTWYYPAKMPKL